jgi:hypothetical protein
VVLGRMWGLSRGTIGSLRRRDVILELPLQKLTRVVPLGLGQVFNKVLGPQLRAVKVRVAAHVRPGKPEALNVHGY